MPKFRVLIECRGISGRLFDEPGKEFGFLATRWVEAINPSAAELETHALLRREYVDWMKSAMEGEASPTMHILEIDEISTFPPDYVNLGVTFFPMDRED